MFGKVIDSLIAILSLTLNTLVFFTVSTSFKLYFNPLPDLKMHLFILISSHQDACNISSYPLTQILKSGVPENKYCMLPDTFDFHNCITLMIFKDFNC